MKFKFLKASVFKVIMVTIIKISFVILLCCCPMKSMTANPQPRSERQPDGKNILLKGCGDFKDHFETDLQDYLVMQNKDGAYVYANELPNGDVVPSNVQVGKKLSSLKGLRRRNCTKKKCGNIQSNCINRKCGHVQNSTLHDTIDIYRPECRGKKCGQGERRRRAIATTGTLKNLVVLLQFRDHTKNKKRKKNIPSVEDIGILMNGDEPDKNLCPSGSLKGIYRELSYGNLNIESTVTEWYQTKETEAYYADTQSGGSGALHEALREALDYLDKEGIINFKDFDADGDGSIDAITFLHSGFAAEWMGKDCYKSNYVDRIWSHKWRIWSDSSGSRVGPWVSKDGVTVSDYHISPALWSTCGEDIGRVGVIAHETGHLLGLPDLYDTDGGGNGIGHFGLMANSWGWDGEQLYPSHMSAWSKYTLGWMVASKPSRGLNFVNHAESTEMEEGHLYKIGDGDFGFPEGEYLLIENRQPVGLDSQLPQGGLVIYHIDEYVGNSQSEGYPGQSTTTLPWPSNGLHYRVALVQADGMYGLEKGHDMGSSGDLFHGGQQGVASLLPSFSDSSVGPFPNTDSYQFGDIEPTGVGIYNISKSGETMSFVFFDGHKSDPALFPTPVTSLERPDGSFLSPHTTAPSTRQSSNPSQSVSSPPTIQASSLTPTLTKAPVQGAVCATKRQPCSTDSDCCNSKAKCKHRKKLRALVCSK